MSPQITLWFLQGSRSIRTAWLLEELGLDYTLKFSDRDPDKKAPPEFKKACGNPLGKFPTLQDGTLTLGESGAITEYLCETYDKEHKLIPKDPSQRAKVQEWIHASEATFMLHAIAIVYTQWNIPEAAKSYLPEIEKGMSVNVQNDLDWLESELSRSPGRFLFGVEVKAADIMLQFSVDYVVRKGLGTGGRKWEGIEKWLKACEEREEYKRAVEKTGHKI